MKQHKKDKEYKKALALIEEKNDLYKKQRNLPLVKLDEPYHKGWEVTVRLRNDIANRQDAEELLKALSYGYKDSKTIWTKKAVKQIRAGQYTYEVWSWQHNKYITQSYYPEKISYKVKDFEEKIPLELRQYFRLRTYRNKNGKVYDHRYLIDLPNYYTELKVRKRMVTHANLHNPDIQKRIDEIEEIFEQRQYWALFDNGHRRKEKSWDSKRRAKEKQESRKIMNIELNND